MESMNFLDYVLVLLLVQNVLMGGVVGMLFLLLQKAKHGHSQP